MARHFSRSDRARVVNVWGKARVDVAMAKHTETRESTYCTLFAIYLFDVIPAFDLFSVFLNRSGIAFSDDGSEDIRNIFKLFV